MNRFDKYLYSAFLLGVVIIALAAAGPPPPVLRSWLTTNLSTGTFLDTQVPTWDAAQKKWTPGTGGGGGGGIQTNAGTGFNNILTNLEVPDFLTIGDVLNYPQTVLTNNVDDGRLHFSRGIDLNGDVVSDQAGNHTVGNASTFWGAMYSSTIFSTKLTNTGGLNNGGGGTNWGPFVAKQITPSRAVVANANGVLTNAGGTTDGTKFLRDDNTYATPASGQTNLMIQVNGVTTGMVSTLNFTNSPTVTPTVTSNNGVATVSMSISAIVSSMIQTNFVLNQAYTNANSTPVLINSSVYMITAAVNGDCSIDLMTSYAGGAYFLNQRVAIATLLTGGLALPITNNLVGVVSNQCSYYFTNTSSGSGNSAGLVAGGQITVIGGGVQGATGPQGPAGAGGQPVSQLLTNYSQVQLLASNNLEQLDFNLGRTIYITNILGGTQVTNYFTNAYNGAEIDLHWQGGITNIGLTWPTTTPGYTMNWLNGTNTLSRSNKWCEVSIKCLIFGNPLVTNLNCNFVEQP